MRRAIKVGETVDYFADKTDISFWDGNEMLEPLPPGSKVSLLFSDGDQANYKGTYLGGCTVKVREVCGGRKFKEEMGTLDTMGRYRIRLDSLPPSQSA